MWTSILRTSIVATIAAFSSSSKADPTPARSDLPLPMAWTPEGRTNDARGGLSLAAVFAEGAFSAIAIRGHVVRPIDRATAIGIAFGLTPEERLSDATSRRMLDGRSVRAGVAIDLGAPWTSDLFGVQAELGIAGGQHRLARSYQPSADDVREQYVTGYGALTALVQWFPAWRRNPVRPYNALGIVVTPKHYRETTVLVTLDLGIAFHLW